VGPRAGLDDMEMRKILLLPGTQTPTLLPFRCIDYAIPAKELQNCEHQVFRSIVITKLKCLELYNSVCMHALVSLRRRLLLEREARCELGFRELSWLMDNRMP
jgi:hypothetical protein